jgi:hypothetical protein
LGRETNKNSYEPRSPALAAPSQQLQSINQNPTDPPSQHDVPLSDDLAESLTPSKDVASLTAGTNAGASGGGDGGGAFGQAGAEIGGASALAERQGILLRIAKAAKRQGLYHLATKKFTQVGRV